MEVIIPVIGHIDGSKVVDGKVIEKLKAIEYVAGELGVLNL